MAKFAFLIAPRTHFLDLAGPDQVFSEAIFYKAPFEIEYCSFMPDQAGTASGLQFANIRHYQDLALSKGDYIFIPGMDFDIITRLPGDIRRQLAEWFRGLHQRGVYLCSVCTGAFLLADSGLLDGKSCTTHWKYTQLLQEKYPKTKVQENVLFTAQGTILTSAGIASGIDLALYIVEKEMGPHFAHRVAREIVVYIRRDGAHAQQSIFLEYRNHLHQGIHTVQDYLTEHIDKKNTLPELAVLANMSTRNFTRLFKKETGITINHYITLLRTEKIRALLKNKNLSRRQVAQQVGLQSERHLGRLLGQ